MLFTHYRIYLKNSKPITEAFIPKNVATNELEALKIWYLHINSLGGDFKNFEYQTEKQ